MGERGEGGVREIVRSITPEVWLSMSQCYVFNIAYFEFLTNAILEGDIITWMDG